MKNQILFIFFIISYYSFSQGSCYSPNIFQLNNIDCPENYPYILVFEDNFNGNNLDLSKWQIQSWNPLTTDNLQEYNSLNNVIVENGYCKIIAKKETVTERAKSWLSDYEILDDGLPNLRTYYYTSSSLWSLIKVKYGKFEIRCKIPKGKGFWPAFWMYDDQPIWNEIDVFDGFRPGGNCSLYETHCVNMGYITKPSGNDCGAEHTLHDFDTDYSNDFHIYSVEWDEYGIKWKVDGITRHDVVAFYDFYTGQSVNCNNINGLYYKKYLPDVPLQIIFNLQISRSTPPDESTPFPSAYEIDYIKVWKHDKGCCIPYKLYEATDNLPSATHVNDYITAGNNAGISDINGDVTVRAGQDVTFTAGNNIDLLPGFTVETGANFTAKLEDCTPLNQPSGDDITNISVPDDFSPDGDGIDDKLWVYVNGATSYQMWVVDKDPPYNTFYTSGIVPINSNPVSVWDGECNYNSNCWFYHKCNRKRRVSINFYNCDKTEYLSKIIDVNCSSNKSANVSNDTTSNNSEAGLSLNKEVLSFKISPNPCKSFAHIEYFTKNNNLIVEFYDFTGKQIKRCFFEGGENSKIIDLSEFSDGVYTYRVYNENGLIKTDKLIIIK